MKIVVVFQPDSGSCNITFQKDKDQIFILYPGSRKTTAFGRDVAPQGRYSETTVFARGAPLWVNFLEKNNTFLRRIPKPGRLQR